MIVMLCRFNIVLTCYNVKIITFTRLRTKRYRWKQITTRI